MKKIIAVLTAVAMMLSLKHGPGQAAGDQRDEAGAGGAHGGTLGRREPAEIDAADHQAEDQEHRPDVEERSPSAPPSARRPERAGGVGMHRRT